MASRGLVDEAIAHYEKALEIRPAYVEAHYNLGNALARRSHLDEAIAHYEKALQIKPGFAEAHYNLGIVLAARGQLEAAITHFQKALEIKPDYADARRNLDSLRARQKLILKTPTRLDSRPISRPYPANLAPAPRITTLPAARSGPGGERPW